jgi:hypothetical protein
LSAFLWFQSDVQGSGFKGSGFGVQGFKGSGFGVQRFRVEGSKFRVQRLTYIRIKKEQSQFWTLLFMDFPGML